MSDTKRVLIVEDVAEMRELLRAALGTMKELKVSGVAANCAEARFEIERRRPSVVLLDEILPGESSLDLLADLKAALIPVVLMTGVSDRAAPLPEGASSRVRKPDAKLSMRIMDEIKSALLAAR